MSMHSRDWPEDNMDNSRCPNNSVSSGRTRQVGVIMASSGAGATRSHEAGNTAGALRRWMQTFWGAQTLRNSRTENVCNDVNTDGIWRRDLEETVKFNKRRNTSVRIAEATGSE